MPLSWNEIRHNAIRFSKEWAQTLRERQRDLGAGDHAAERSLAQSFWLEFFEVFGIRKQLTRSFEVPVKTLAGSWGYIDLFWKRTLLVEHKSPGKSLAKAEQQANDYIQALITHGREADVPRYVVVTDFLNLVLEDRHDDTRLEFPLADLHKHIHAFAFIPGYKQHVFKEQDPINIEAAEILGKLHDELEAGGYSGHQLEQFLVRILFCLFAEDTGLFERSAFQLYLENHTKADGSDLGLHLARLFAVLNQPPDKRQKNLDEDLALFPYVNGDLFAEPLDFADFNRALRDALLECCAKDWEQISPAIFGSLFQSIMQPKARRQIGAHYTSERDILKVVRSLFLDDLTAEFKAIQADRSTRRAARMDEYHQKLCALKFFDPACGCGNFLVLTYRELRELELQLLIEINGTQRELTLDEVNKLSQLDVHQFYGIEIEEWPAKIAEVALWLMDHQMNRKILDAFGQPYQRLPLKKSPHIHTANALRLDWKTVLPPEQCSYVLGNPPFVGAKLQNNEQRADMDAVAGQFENSGVLDYVTGWYFKAAEYIQGTKISVGFVSTSSISQGEQVGVLWNPLFQRFGLKIHFAHRSFDWISEARGKAQLDVVIIGFGTFDVANKRIYDYQDNKVSVSSAKQISPYLIDGSSTTVTNRSNPICNVPEMGIGNKPIDDGNYLFTLEGKKEFLKEEPAAKEFMFPFFGADDYLQNKPRWCLWLGDCPPEKLRQMPEVLKRVNAVKKFREDSKSAPTKKLAATPTRFHVENIPNASYLLIPRHSSEKRKYIPIGYVKPIFLAGDSCLIISDTSLFHFGVLTSAMHMAWVRQVCGRLESRYRYSAGLVYNNYPWPVSPNQKQVAAVEKAAQKVLAVRKDFPKSTLADLYHPLSMPPELVKAHADLDRAVDLCYRPEPFTSERQRVEYLFGLYEQLTAPLLPAAGKKRKKAVGLYSQKLPKGKDDTEPAAVAAFYNIMGKEDTVPYKTS